MGDTEKNDLDTDLDDAGDPLLNLDEPVQEPQEAADEDQTLMVGGVMVDGDKFLELTDGGMSQEDAIAASRTDSPDATDATDAHGHRKEGSEPDSTDATDATDAPDAPLDATERDRVANVLRRAGWPADRVAASLDGTEAERGFALDQAQRFTQTQDYIERNVRGQGAEPNETDTDDPPNRHEEDPTPPALDLDGSSRALFETLSAELGDESSAALQSLLEHSTSRATARAESQMQEALAPMAGFMERMVRRELGEQFPELLESESAWVRTVERAKTLSTVKEGDMFSLVAEAAAELKYKRTEESSQKAKRQQAARNLEPVTDGFVGTVQPASSDEAWEQYFHAVESGNKEDATRFKALHDRLARQGK